MAKTTELPIRLFQIARDQVYLSGQIGDKDGSVVSGGVTAEAQQALANIKEVLKDVGQLYIGRGPAVIVKATVYLTNMDDYGDLNAVWAKEFEGAKNLVPARTCICVTALPFGARIEIDVIAVLM